MTSKHAHRKDEHVSLAEKFHHEADTFRNVRLIHESLPELGLADIDTGTTFASKRLAYPIFIEAMTGGSEKTGHLNRQLATLSSKFNLAMAVGSQSVAMTEPEQVATFANVREVNPNGVVIANLGADHSLKDCEQAIRMVAADALQLHVNATQELIMPEGDTAFYWQQKIATAVTSLKTPVIVKEVGFGMAKETITTLRDSGVTYIDVSGRGGTSFAAIENFRRSHKEFSFMTDWGQTTPESLLERQAVANAPAAFASGGIQTPLDAIKALVLGASYVGMAGEILHHLITTSLAETEDWLADWLAAFKSLMLLTGSRTVDDLKNVPYVLTGDLRAYRQDRNL